MSPHTAELDADLVLDQLIDECHQIHTWLREVIEDAVDGITDLDHDGLDPRTNRPLTADRVAWKIVTGLLAHDVTGLPIGVGHRLQTRLGAPVSLRGATVHEEEAADLLCRLLAVAATATAVESRDEDDGPALARAMVDDVHHRLRSGVGCIEWLSGLREGKLARRNTTRDAKLADRTYLEAARLIRGG